MLTAEKSKGIPRNSSIELLRIITMIGVIILHYNNSNIGGAFRSVDNGTVNQYYLYVTENMFICAVNLFILISAYFLSCTQKRKLSRVIELLIEVSFFRCMFYILGVIDGNEIFSIKQLIFNILPEDYFVILYSVVYLLSPYINLMLDRMSKENFRKLLILLVSLFSVYTIIIDVIENVTGDFMGALSTVGMYGSQNGYTIVNFLLVYFVGAYIRRTNITLSSKKAIIGTVLVLAIMCITSITEHIIGFKATTTWNYNNPLVILIAVLVFLLFLNIRINSKVINELAKCAFTCYLFHIPIMSILFIENMVNRNLPILILHQFGVSIAIYLVSYIVYRIYNLFSEWFIKLITPICDKINVSVEE